MATTKVKEQPRPQVLMMPWRDVIRVALAGVVIGLVTAALYVVLDKYVFTPALCGEATAAAGRCGNKLYFASALAMILSALGGLFAMVQLRVFRPLLVVLLVTIGLWNVVLLIDGLVWWQMALAAGLLFAVAYAAFAWLVQLRNFFLALGLGAVVVVLLRLIIMS